MSTTRTASFRRHGLDHFEPSAEEDPATLRKMRGSLEQIDYTAYAANQAVVAQTLGHADTAQFQKLAIAAATARARWVAEALTLAQAGGPAPADAVDRLAKLRQAYEELADAYEALRRLVERGYLPYRGG